MQFIEGSLYDIKILTAPNPELRNRTLVLHKVLPANREVSEEDLLLYYGKSHPMFTNARVSKLYSLDNLRLVFKTDDGFVVVPYIRHSPHVKITPHHNSEL